ncbi:hypothetical protein ABMA27_009761 [Loxostege sticticalis]|uniref:Uncharacterized protein n=1 Tax=Loxostege sticticalis TaxID=481309 RepID=A0ABR3H6C9_LOXSC
MGIGCSCGPCDSPWGRIRTRLETAAKRRKNARRTCLCRRRPRFLRIRRKTSQKKKKCTCQPNVKYCVQEASSVVCGSQASSPDLSPPVKNVCRFTYPDFDIQILYLVANIEIQKHSIFRLIVDDDDGKNLAIKLKLSY